jgi:hypothetical protein
MSDWSNAKAAIETSIATDKTYLALQDVPATLTATFATIDTIKAALKHWSRAASALEAVNTAADDLPAALAANPELVALAKGADSIIAHVTELKNLVGTWAAKARL